MSGGAVSRYPTTPREDNSSGYYDVYLLRVHRVLGIFLDRDDGQLHRNT